MADSKTNRGERDRDRVSASEPYEVYYVARKYGVSADTVRKTIKKVGTPARRSMQRSTRRDCSPVVWLRRKSRSPANC